MADNLLDNLSTPALKAMKYKELKRLCAEIRDLIIITASENGGHLASNLGVVELTVALHRVFDSPIDQIVFDVGHQCYTHKILTGRLKDFPFIRTENGISGFSRPTESIHDTVVSGHSSTSISIACGLARAKSLTGQRGAVIAVIGDGALTGGLAYEGLDDAGKERDNIIVVLNDNHMSISANVGAMARYLTNVRTKKSYINFKSKLNYILLNTPLIGNSIRRFLLRTKSLIKRSLYGSSTMFDSLGFAYIGPIDGHNQQMLEQALEIAKSLKRPTLVHVCTVKGKGYAPAEQNPEKFHGIGGFDSATGMQKCYTETFSDVFGNTMCRLATMNNKVCAVTAAMEMGTGLEHFAHNCSERFFDCGIAEEHAIVFCAGLAVNGMRPVFAVYSSFLQRGYDQIIHDVAISGLPVTLAIDRAGLIGEDGETHQGLFDIPMLNSVPGMTVYSPTYFSELRFFLESCIEMNSPSAVRYPRGCEPYMPLGYKPNFSNFELIGDQSGSCLLVSFGREVAEVFRAVDMLKNKGFEVSILKLNRVMPIDIECVKLCERFTSVHFFEEGLEFGGIGERFAYMLEESGSRCSFKVHAINNQFVSQASVESQLKRFKLDSDSISRIIMEEMNLE